MFCFVSCKTKSKTMRGKNILWAKGIPHARFENFSARCLRYGGWKQSCYPGIKAAFNSTTEQLMKKNAMKPPQQQFDVNHCNGIILKCLKCMSSQYCNVTPRKSDNIEHEFPISQSICTETTVGRKIMAGRVELIDKFSLRNAAVTSP